MYSYLEEKDIDNCLALMELVKNDFAGYSEKSFIQSLYDAIATKEAYIAYHENEIAGLITFSYRSKEIMFLAVNPKFRNGGIAKGLINYVKKCFRPGDMLQVVTFRENDPKGRAAVECYHSCGFIDVELLEVRGYPCQKMIMWI